MRFYCDTLGFKLVANQGDTYIWVESNGVEILLRPPADYPLPCVVMYSDKPELESVESERRGACLHFEDPTGNSMQVVDPEADHSD